VLTDTSKHGTFVNQLPARKTRVFAGDRIRFGGRAKVQLVFLVGDEDVPTDPIGTAPLSTNDFPHLANMMLGLSALGPERVVNEVLALVLDSAIDVTGAERGFIMLADTSGRLEFKLARLRGRVTQAGKEFRTSVKFPRRVFATGEPCIVEDLQKMLDHEGTAGLGIRYVLCVPLQPVQFVESPSDRRDERPIGVLYLDSQERGGVHSSATIAAIRTLSAHAALAIENARLYREMYEKDSTERELEAAAAIQRSLLPAGYHAGPFHQIAGTSASCRAVGGDFFDYVDVPNGAFGFIVGDVAGKGPPAALLAAAAMGMFGAEASNHATAAALVARLNRVVLRRAVESRYLTAFYGVLDPNGSLIFCNAGHNPPMLVTAAGIERLTIGGGIVGMFDAATFADGRVMMAPGDVVVAYTDGVTEGLDAHGEEFGDARLLDTVDRLRREPVERIVSGVVEALRLFCGDQRPTDDVTVVAVQYRRD